MKPSIQLRRSFEGNFKVKQDRIRVVPGILGNGTGVVAVPGRRNYVYVQIAGSLDEVFNNKVPAEGNDGMSVLVGYDSIQPDIYQVLSTLSYAPGGTTGGAVGGYTPASRYEWFGDDPLWIDLRQFLPLRVGIYTGLMIQIYRGTVYTSTGAVFVDTQLFDMTSFIPSTVGNTAYVLMTVDSTGAIVGTKGTEVSTPSPVEGDVPDVPAGTVDVLAAVRVYYGQVVFVENATDTDIWDLRFSGWMPADPLAHDAVTVTDTATIDLTLTGQALSADLKSTTVTAGSYTATDLTVDAQGRITAAANGAGGGGSGDVIGPATSTDNTIARFNGTDNKTIQGSLAAVDDSGGVNIPTGQTYNINGSPHTHAGSGSPYTAPPALSSWTWVNQGSATATEANDSIYLLTPAAAGDNMKLLVRAAPATPYTVTACVQIVTTQINYIIAGLVWRESSSGKIITCSTIYNNYFGLGSYYFSSPTAYNALPNASPFTFSPGLLWLQMSDNGTNRFWRWGPDGHNFMQFYTAARTTFATPDQIGICVSAEQATWPVGLNLLSWAVT